MARNRIKGLLQAPTKKTQKTENILQLKQKRLLKLYHGIISSQAHRISSIVHADLTLHVTELDCENDKVAGVLGAY